MPCYSLSLGKEKEVEVLALQLSSGEHCLESTDHILQEKKVTFQSWGEDGGVERKMGKGKRNVAQGLPSSTPGLEGEGRWIT